MLLHHLFRFIPGKDDLTEDSWNKMSSLTFGNLMSAACRSVSMLADMSEEVKITVMMTMLISNNSYLTCLYNN